MPLQRYLYTVHYRPDPADDSAIASVDVEVCHGDLLRAELEAGKQNLPVDPRLIPQQTTTIWVWCALVRTKVIDVDYRTFRDGLVEGDQVTRAPVLVGVEQRKDLNGDPEAVDVPPTSPDSVSPSPSLPGSATSHAGSIPTPTND